MLYVYICLHTIVFMFRIQIDDFLDEYNLISGFIPLSNSNKIVTISIVYKTPPRILQIKARSSMKLKFLTSIQYSEPTLMEEYHIQYELTKERAIEVCISYKTLKIYDINKFNFI
mgnify:CR=1 FL=1